MFNNVDHAIVWARNEKYKLCIKNASINQNYRAPRNDTMPILRLDNNLLLGLSSQERQTQASWIINSIRKLEPIHASEYIALKYHLVPARSDSVVNITKHLLRSALHDIRAPDSKGRHLGVSLAIVKYFGGKVGSALSRRSIRSENKAKVCEELDKLNCISNSLLKDIFTEKGLIKG